MKRLHKILPIALLSLTVTGLNINAQVANANTTKQPIQIAQNSQAASYYQEAVRLLDAKKYREAIAVINKVIVIEPNNQNAYYLRGICYQYLEQQQQAKADFTNVIKLDPTFPYGYLSRGVSNYLLRENNSAIQDFKTAADLFTKVGDTKMAETALRFAKRVQE
ncbi:TPR repeat-containing protein [Calothrix sp. NIES-4101]|nr:TPR repeat-containing protein [Calothrix sp. NIES-4101]